MAMLYSAQQTKLFCETWRTPVIHLFLPAGGRVGLAYVVVTWPHDVTPRISLMGKTIEIAYLTLNINDWI